ncbi:MAG: hypothetical protein ACRD2B_03530 [Terriglobia bacterium]
MKLKEIDRWMTRVTDALTKLEQVADLDGTLEKKLHQLTDFPLQAEKKISSASTKLEALADLPARTERGIERAVGALLKRENS